MRIICSRISDGALCKDDGVEKGKADEEEENYDALTKETNKLNLNCHVLTHSDNKADNSVSAAFSSSRRSCQFIPKLNVGVDTTALSSHNGIVEGYCS